MSFKLTSRSVGAVAPITAPVSASPASGSVSVGNTVTITVDFGQTVTVVGTPTLNLNTGGVASYTSGSGTNILTFSYTVGGGDTPQSNLAIIGCIPYRTLLSNFSPENPISENGVWVHLGTPWAKVQTVSSPEHACGTQSGTGGFDDSYAHLQAGYGSNVDTAVQATVYKNPSMSPPGGIQEVELHSRWVDSSSSAQGYECYLAWDGAYCDITRWNGGLGSFSLLTHQTTFSAGLMPPVTGDVFMATTVGPIITAYIKKIGGDGLFHQLSTATDSTYTTGEPGMGMYIQDPGSVNSDYGFTDWQATAGTIAINDGSGNQVVMDFIPRTFTGLQIL